VKELSCAVCETLRVCGREKILSAQRRRRRRRRRCMVDRPASCHAIRDGKGNVFTVSSHEEEMAVLGALDPPSSDEESSDCTLPLPQSFIESALPTRKQYEASLSLPDNERSLLEVASLKKAAAAQRAA
jgi:hypothetical protein